MTLENNSKDNTDRPERPAALAKVSRLVQALRIADPSATKALLKAIAEGSRQLATDAARTLFQEGRLSNQELRSVRQAFAEIGWEWEETEKSGAISWVNALAEAEKIVSLLTASDSLTDAFPMIASEVSNLVPANWVSLAILNESGKSVMLLGSFLDIPGTIMQHPELELEGTSVDWVLQRREMNIRPIAAKRFLEDSWLYDAGMRGFVVVVPIRAQGGVLGTLSVARRSTTPFLNTEQETIQRLAWLISTGLSYAKTLRKLEERTEEVLRLAVTDELTGLKNRRAFNEQLRLEFAKAVRYDHHLSLLMVDLDTLKTINDKYGHESGDIALKHLASTFANNARETDIVARVGGDEFAFILTDTKVEDAALVAEKLRKLTETTPLKLGNSTVRITLSIGVATYVASDNMTRDDLFRRADAALYLAKANGKNQVCVYSPELTTANGA